MNDIDNFYKIFSIELIMYSRIMWDRTEQGTQPTRKPDSSTRQVLGGSENIQVGYWAQILGYFRVWVSVGSVSSPLKYTTSKLNSHLKSR